MQRMLSRKNTEAPEMRVLMGVGRPERYGSSRTVTIDSVIRSRLFAWRLLAMAAARLGRE